MAPSNVVATRNQGPPKNNFIYTEMCSESLMDQNLDVFWDCEDAQNLNLDNYPLPPSPKICHGHSAAMIKSFYHLVILGLYITWNSSRKIKNYLCRLQILAIVPAILY